jgi:signal transduction histidine kinase
MVQIMKEMNHEPEMSEYLGLLSRIIDNLTETIAIQRDLMNAEKRELYVNKKLVSVKQIINSVIDNSMFQELLDKRKIHTILDNPDLEFYTDPVLLNRVLINMVKNALEATNIIPDITLGCSYSGRYIAFYVHNLAFIDDEMAKYIFQPIDSGKGSNRGLGTYSIRLIGENYLKGKVSFNTHPESGTTFTIELPVDTVPA